MEIGSVVLFVISGVVLGLLVLSTIFGLPGNLLVVIFAAALGYYEDFNRFDWTFLAILAAAWLLGEGIEFFSSAIGAKQAQASRRAIICAYIGTFLGMFAGTAILPVIGTVAGSLIGAFCAGYWGEYQQTGSGEQAKRVALHVVAGQLLGLIVKISIGAAMAVAVLMRLPIGN